MRWLADECVAAPLVARLRETGDNVVYIAEIAKRSPDSEVIAMAQEQERLLLTDDKDFGELVFRRWQVVPGLVLIRVDPANHELMWQRLQGAVERFGAGLFGRYLVIEETRFRSRPLPPQQS